MNYHFFNHFLKSTIGHIQLWFLSQLHGTKMNYYWLYYIYCINPLVIVFHSDSYVSQERRLAGR